jgi:hypothetical protein
MSDCMQLDQAELPKDQARKSHVGCTVYIIYLNHTGSPDDRVWYGHVHYINTMSDYLYMDHAGSPDDQVHQMCFTVFTSACNWTTLSCLMTRFGKAMYAIFTVHHVYTWTTLGLLMTRFGMAMSARASSFTR